ncbi:Glutamate dehydrogenase, NAD-specific [Cynara cardunculus var. scolymus]|uniref:Glutamate dehydrogenase, NAD-specific n=1 Tax=Cynara cardunculus var. scolymus TaxID=59895 RepID=A0A103XM68_CYNCS|nr:Glutamate dehydrogenase, NAD-specific [Cynara cardunculus var. scolymus]
MEAKMRKYQAAHYLHGVQTIWIRQELPKHFAVSRYINLGLNLCNIFTTGSFPQISHSSFDFRDHFTRKLLFVLVQILLDAVNGAWSSASLTIFSISLSERPPDDLIVICCSLPVVLSLAETVTIPFASMSNKQFFNITTKNTTLNSCSHGNCFIRIHSFAWSFPKNFCNNFLNFRNTSHPTNKENFIHLLGCDSCILHTTFAWWFTRASNFDLVRVIFKCLAPEASAVINGKLISVWVVDDSSILAFSAASLSLWRASLSFVKFIPSVLLNSLTKKSNMALSKSSPPRNDSAAAVGSLMILCTSKPAIRPASLVACLCASLKVDSAVRKAGHLNLEKEQKWTSTMGWKEYRTRHIRQSYIHTNNQTPIHSELLGVSKHKINSLEEKDSDIETERQQIKEIKVEMRAHTDLKAEREADATSRRRRDLSNAAVAMDL